MKNNLIYSGFKVINNQPYAIFTINKSSEILFDLEQLQFIIDYVEDGLIVSQKQGKYLEMLEFLKQQEQDFLEKSKALQLAPKEIITTSQLKQLQSKLYEHQVSNAYIVTNDGVEIVFGHNPTIQGLLIRVESEIITLTNSGTRILVDDLYLALDDLTDLAKDTIIDLEEDIKVLKEKLTCLESKLVYLQQILD